MRRISIALLVAACTAGATWAAPPSEADRSRADALAAEGAAAAQRGDAATALRLFGDATRLVRDADRAHQLGHLYERQRDLPDQDAQANQWFAFAAELGHAESMEHLGERYLYGRNGLARDVNRGVELLLAAERAADESDDARVGTVLAAFRRAQQEKARCMLGALRAHAMQEAPFSAGTLYQVRTGRDAEASGDVFRVRGLEQHGTPIATLDVQGFAGRSGSHVNGVFIPSGSHTATAASATGRELARSVRERCGVDE